jgi:hypothetical protein
VGGIVPTGRERGRRGLEGWVREGLDVWGGGGGEG